MKCPGPLVSKIRERPNPDMPMKSLIGTFPESLDLCHVSLKDGRLRLRRGFHWYETRSLVLRFRDYPSPECRWSTSQHSRSFRGFPYREIGTSDVAIHMYHEFSNPELRSHLSSTRAWGPTLPRPLRDFADRGSTIQVSSWSKTPKRRTPKPRSPTSRDRATLVLIQINGSR